MAKVERKFLAHYLNAALAAEATALYYRLGKDLEEYNVEMSATVEKKKNIIGESSINVSSYETSSSVEPYYADEDDDLFDFLQDIVDNRKVLDDVRTDAVEVHLWEPVSTGEGEPQYVAYKETAYVEVTSYGGDSTGYQIKFNVHYQGDRVKGTFDPITKTFTADTQNTASVANDDGDTGDVGDTGTT